MATFVDFTWPLSWILHGHFRGFYMATFVDFTWPLSWILHGRFRGFYMVAFVDLTWACGSKYFLGFHMANSHGIYMTTFMNFHINFYNFNFIKIILTYMNLTWGRLSKYSYEFHIITLMNLIWPVSRIFILIFIKLIL